MFSTEILTEAVIELTRLTYNPQSILEGFNYISLIENADNEDLKGSFKENIKKIIDLIKKYLFKFKVFVKEKYLKIKMKLITLIDKISSKINISSTIFRVPVILLYTSLNATQVLSFINDIFDLIKKSNIENMDENKDKILNLLNKKLTTTVTGKIQKDINEAKKELKNLLAGLEKSLSMNMNYLNEIQNKLSSIKEGDADILRLATFRVEMVKKTVDGISFLIQRVQLLIISLNKDFSEKEKTEKEFKK